jgi:hypothetical protein
MLTFSKRYPAYLKIGGKAYVKFLVKDMKLFIIIFY